MKTHEAEVLAGMAAQYAASVDWLLWNDPDRHGPWEHELAQECDCGMVVFDHWSHYRNAPDEHNRAIFERYGPTDWERLLDEVENGLGWAESESMSGEVSHDEVMALLRIALADRLGRSSE